MCGVVSLKTIYDFFKERLAVFNGFPLANDAHGRAQFLFDVIQNGNHRFWQGCNQNTNFNQNTKIALQTIPLDVSGIYVWGRYIESDNQLLPQLDTLCWKSIYVGKGRNLQQRIKEEVREESAFLFKAAGYSCDEIEGAANEEYLRNLRQGLRKSGSTHVVWASCGDRGEIEKWLIRYLNPIANDSRPIPIGGYKAAACNTINQIRQAIIGHEDHYSISETGLSDPWPCA